MPRYQQLRTEARGRRGLVRRTALPANARAMALATVRLEASLPMWVALFNRQGCRWYVRSMHYRAVAARSDANLHEYLHLQVAGPENRGQNGPENRAKQLPMCHGRHPPHRNPEPGAQPQTATGSPSVAGKEPAIDPEARGRRGLVRRTALPANARAMALATVRLEAIRPMWVALCNRQGCRWYGRYLPFLHMGAPAGLFKTLR